MYIFESKGTSGNKNKTQKFGDLRTVQIDPGSPINPGENYYIHKLPKFPSFVKGKLYRYSDYKMDLYNLTCSCEYQKLKREKYKDRDVRLLCKHLYYKILKTSSVQVLDSLSLEIMKTVVFFGEEQLYKYSYKDQDIILGFNEVAKWVNVYAPNKNNIEVYYRYSYDPIDVRWSYNNEPEYGPLISDLINRVIKYQLTFSHAGLNRKSEE